MPKILTIDDRKDNLTSISALLKNYIPNCNVITAASGAEGIEKAKQDLPDTILLDIIMPVMDGYEVCQKLKSDDVTKHIPVIMLTAMKTDSKSRIKGLELGADAFLTKPVDPTELTAQVNTMLRIKNAEDKLRGEKENLEQLVAERTKELQLSEEKYSSVVLNSKDAIIIHINGIIKFVNPAATELSGYSAEELIETNLIELVVPEHRKLVAQRFSDRTEGKQIINLYEINIIKKDSSLLPIELNATRMEYEQENAVLVFIRDISERKQAEDKIKESEEKFREIFENKGTATGIFGDDGIIINCNSKFEEMSGFTKEEIEGKMKWSDFVVKEDLERLQKYHSERKKTSASPPSHYECGINNKNGERVYVTVDIALTREYRIVSLTDITDRKQAEEALHESSTKNEALLSAIPEMMFVLSKNGTYLDYKAEKENELAIPREEIIGKNLSETGFSRGRVKFILSQIEDTLKTGKIHSFEYKLKIHNSDNFYDARLVPFGKDSILATVRNITESKKTETALRQSEERFRRLFEDLGDAVFVTKVGGTDRGDIMEANPAAEKQTGYTKNELVSMNIINDLSIPKSGEFSSDEWEKKLYKGDIVTTVEEKRKKDGSYYWTEVTVTPIKFKGIKASLSINHDITERKQAEEQIKKSLKEKNILIKEIYHRVKNNLAVVSSLLNMQSKYINDKKAIEAFKETRDRVMSMSMVHTQLYNSDDYTNVEYKKYVKNLVSRVFYTAKISGQVKLHLELDDVTVPIDKAIPCGLLLNELVTNALKHAFPKNRKGNLRIIMRSLKDENCEIIVKDDGVGIPENFDLEKSKSLGLKLINLLVKQISGTLEIESKQGTEFRIRLNTKAES